MSDGRRITRMMLKILAGGILLLVLLAVFHGNCQLTSLTVSGSEHYSDEEIKEMTLTNYSDKYAVFFYLRWIRNQGRNLPFIEKIDASLVNKNSVHLTVYEKRIIGCVEMMGQLLYFDRDGLITETSSRKLEQIPLVTGLEFDNIVLHQKLSVQSESLFRTILNLVRLVEQYGIEAEQIEFLYDRSVVLHLSETEVRIGRREVYDEVIAPLPDILSTLDDKNVILFMENYSEKYRDIVAKPK